MESFSLSNEVLNKALELLKKYPLCDSCLGRCFAKLGSGLSNEERGKAIKITLLLQLDYIIKEHKINDLNELKELLFNIGEEAKGTFSLYFNEEFQRRDCYLCGGQLEEWKNDFYSKSLDLIKLQGIKPFILGVKLSETLKAIEHNFIEENGLMYYESVKNEVKREVGKRLATAGFPPNMENPDVEILYDIGSRSVKVEEQHKYYIYFFIRTKRNVPLASWYSKDGQSLENSLQITPISYFSEPSEVRIFDEYYILLRDFDKDLVSLPIGYVLKKGDIVTKKEREALLTIKPSTRLYRVVVYSDSKPEGGFRLADNFYEIIVEAKDFKELKEKLNNYEIVAVDLIDSRGKHKSVASLYLKGV